MTIEMEVNLHIESICRETIQHLVARSEQDVVARALLFLLTRCANTWVSVKTLREYAPNECIFMVDAGALLRAVMDAYLQAAYIVSDAELSDQRASDYFEFEHVERYDSLEKLLRYNNWLATKVKASPRRVEGETRIRAEFERVGGRFRQRNGNLRKHWFRVLYLIWRHQST